MPSISTIAVCLVLAFAFILIPSVSPLTRVWKFVFTLQVIILAALGIMLSFSVTHWLGPLRIGTILLVPACFSRIMKWYRHKAFWYLHLCFAVTMISYTGFLFIVNKKAYEVGTVRFKELQSQVCTGLELKMDGWESNTNHSYTFYYDLLGQHYKLRATVQDDRKTFSVGVFRGYDKVGGPGMEGGPFACGRDGAKR